MVGVGCPACTTWQVAQEKKLRGLRERWVSENRSAPICAAGTEVCPPQEAAAMAQVASAARSLKAPP